MYSKHAIGEDGENDSEATRIPLQALVSLATKDIASCDIVRDLFAAEYRGKQH